MFRSARLKLTAWYLLIIMVVSILFSLVVYGGLAMEIRRSLRAQALRGLTPSERSLWIGRGAPLPETARRLLVPGQLPDRAVFDPEVLEEARNRIALDLVYINLGILVISGAAGYFLAGRTLKPIEDMVDEQKRFVSDASHELRTPLTAMRTGIEVALRDKDLDAFIAKDVLESNLEEIEKLQSLSDYLLTLGRYQNAANNPGFTEVSLADVVEQAHQSVKTLAKAKNIEVEGDIDNIILKADKDSLVKLIVIFLDNAIKYSHENGKVVIRAKAGKNRASISIRDFGAGIRASDLPYIFNRFYRADASRAKSKVQGYGLGLSIAKNIVDMHNGKVDVESTPGDGTTFIISLPIKH